MVSVNKQFFSVLIRVFNVSMITVLILQPKFSYKETNCWEKLEKFNNEELPKCLKKLMEKAAYDRLNSLKSIDAMKIVEIEAFLTEHRSTWINELDCCQSEDYKKQTTFHFLPGHKTILLSMPEQIKQMTAAQHAHARTPAFVLESKTKMANKDQEDDQLMSKLISNLLAFMKKNQFALSNEIISANNIRDFVRGTTSDNFVCKCRFACPFCSKVFPVIFKKFWMQSNVTKHLRSHIEVEQVPVCDDQTSV